MFSLKDKVSVITGGSGHLGYVISEGLAEAGSDVFILGTSKRSSEEAATKISKKTGSIVRGLTVDISSLKSIEQCFSKIIKISDKIDILINNASFSTDGNLERKLEQNWLKGIDGTINGVFRTTKTIIPLMKKHHQGSIINIASMYGTVSPDPLIYGNSGYDNPPEYGSGKAAIIQFTRYLAVHYAKEGIRVNAISPGPFPNKEVQKNKNFISNLRKKTPMHRIGHPHELKGTIVFLASDASSYITGQNINVDGGWTIW